MDHKEFAAARRELGKTQQQLDDEIHRTRRSIGALERGEKKVSKTTEVAIRYLLLVHRGRGGDA